MSFIRLQSEIRRQTIEQRKELMEKGPFNLIFHGVEPDWIETEMDDDPEFRRDVIEQKVKTLIRDGVSSSIRAYRIVTFP